MQIERVYEDENLLVVNKPPGMVVNKSDTQKGSVTLQDWVSENVDILFNSSEDNDFISRHGIVHRLDKDTSGLLIVAKDQSAFQLLQKQFKEKQVEKYYIAIVYGKFSATDFEHEITIDAPIARNPKTREKFAIVETGREAVTHIRPLEYLGMVEGSEFTLAACFPQSGRTHQIRVHLTALNHPVAGDTMYSGNIRSRKFKSMFPRQMLHAAGITFTQPLTGKKIELDSDLPQDMISVIDLIKDGNLS
jgi:23S rRNA pseudouridine1911/1915/1917 synthase